MNAAGISEDNALEIVLKKFTLAPEASLLGQLVDFLDNL